MLEVYIRAVRWVADDPQPGIDECRLLDANGVEHVLIDKSAIFDDADRLRPDASYPIELKLTCRVVREGDADLVVELAHHVESVEGQRTFRVPRSSIA
jgi:hypothetical protein